MTDIQNTYKKPTISLEETLEEIKPIPKLQKPSLKTFFKDRRFALVCGFGLLFFSFYLLIAFVSYLFTGKADQSLVEAHPLKAHKLPLVAITDGATSIKNELKTIFGQDFTHILDWYHLQKKLKETMTMILPKKYREDQCQNMLNLLWNGKSIETIAYLEGISAKNDDAKAMLIKYLDKNEHTIIDYARRKLAGKTIGSGRTEKQNDILVAKRQKYNGMAWSPKGSLAITLVTANYY